MSKDNLVNFPSGSTSLPTVSSVSESLSDLRAETINEITEMIKDDVVNLLTIAGFDASSDIRLLPETLLIIEAIRSLVSKRLGEPHTFQDLAKNVFRFDSETGQVHFLAMNFQFVPTKTKESDADT